MDAVDKYLIDKARVRTSFNRAANSYDAAAVLQKRVREEMLDRLGLINIKPFTIGNPAILDAGCGTGAGSFSLQKRFKKAQVVSLDIAYNMLQKTASQQPFLQKILHKPQLICADIESLPIASNSINLLWSNLALQWCNDLDAAFNEAARVLLPD